MAPVIQKPEMAYSPRQEGTMGSSKTGTSPYDLYAPKSYDQSPFNTVASPITSWAGYTHKNSYEPSAIGKALSDASYPSGPSSPARSSYAPGIHHMMRDSCHSDCSSNSRHSALASPRPLNHAGDIGQAESQRNTQDPISLRAKSQGYVSTSHGSEREELHGVGLEPRALRILVCLILVLRSPRHIKLRLSISIYQI
jgi:hypothetical protein